MCISQDMLGRINAYYEATGDIEKLTALQMADQSILAPSPICECKYEGKDIDDKNLTIKFFHTKNGIQARVYVAEGADEGVLLYAVPEEKIFLNNDSLQPLAQLEEKRKNEIIEDLNVGTLKITNINDVAYENNKSIIIQQSSL